MIKDFCDRAYYINLKRDILRVPVALSEFSSVSIEVERFDAIVHSKPHVGCRKSHQAIIQIAKDRNWDKVIIFEDDIRFHGNVNTAFDLAVKQLPKEWDLFYFGCKPGTLKYYSQNLNMVHSCKLSHAVIYNRSIYDIILNSKEKSMDRTNLLIHPRGKSFCMIPMVCEQEDKPLCLKR